MAEVEQAVITGEEAHDLRTLRPDVDAGSAVDGTLRAFEHLRANSKLSQQRRHGEPGQAGTDDRDPHPASLIVVASVAETA